MGIGLETTASPELQQSLGSIPDLNNANGWESDFVSQPPVWLAQEDFDLDTFNLSILDSTASWIPPVDHQTVLAPINHIHQPLLGATTTKKEDLICQNWYTYLGSNETGFATPDVGIEETQVDEAYRESLAHKLQQRLPSSPLPSTDVLVSCPRD